MSIIALDFRHYPAEISALSARIGSAQLPAEAVVRALTDRSFLERPDVVAEARFAQPALSEQAPSPHEIDTNEELVARGYSIDSFLSLSIFSCV